MELKNYQCQVLKDLEDYLKALDRTNGIRAAWREYWSGRGVLVNAVSGNGVPGYVDDLPGVPNVCIKVPTGGGKTFLAANAVKRIFDALPLGKTRFVMWLVPSEAILAQTVANLSNPQHPYRRQLEQDFAGRVNVYTKEQLLNGQNFKPADVQENLSIAVFCYASIRSNPRSMDDKKIYQENGNLLPFAELFGNKELLLADTPQTALLQVIRQTNPVAIVDESHNAKSELSLAMLKNINPSFVLAMTATPTARSNIISYVNARELKKENMVKLPVIVYHRPDRSSVVKDAVTLRARLEQQAVAAQEAGGSYIRPIVLFQAQPKISEDSATFEQIKASLVKMGIPAEEIAIKTAQKDDLGNTAALLSPTSRIRYIITVNALKEGWDCPFAYILASLANKTSQVDVEQIVGRVLRQPYARQNASALLNMSYVLSCSNDFNGTVQSVVAGLNGAGFSAQDYRIAASIEPSCGGSDEQSVAVQPELPSMEPPEEKDDFSDLENTQLETEPKKDDAVTALTTAAEQQSQNYQEQLADPLGLQPLQTGPVMKNYPISPEFTAEIQNLRVPQFVISSKGGLFATETQATLLSESDLLEGFNLDAKDATVEFSATPTGAVSIDLAQSGDAIPKSKTLSKSDFEQLASYLGKALDEMRLRRFAELVAQNLDKRIDYCTGDMLRKYAARVLEALPADTRSQLGPEMLQPFVDCVLAKISTLKRQYMKSRFKTLANTNAMQCEPFYQFPATIAPGEALTHLEKCLYQGEYNDLDGDEMEVIAQVSSRENVRWWHRIKERKGFCINAYRNIYPDFIVMTEKGNLLLLEVKGGHLDGSADSQEKSEIGANWVAAAGAKYKYFMVFRKESAGVSGALSLENFLNTLDAL